MTDRLAQLELRVTRAEAGALPGDRGIVRAWGPNGGVNYIEGPK